MADLYENIQQLCEEKGIRPGRLCDEVGISRGLMTDLKMGRKKGVSAQTAQKIAAYFGVSVGYLLGQEGSDEVSFLQHLQALLKHPYLIHIKKFLLAPFQV